MSRICRPRATVALALIAALAALTLVAAGCSTHSGSRVLAPKVDSPPAPTTPTGVVELLQWAYTHRDTSVYRTLFTDDFVFVFSSMDSAGSTYRGTPWRQQDEEAYATHLFVTGTPSVAAASAITLEYGALVDTPDPRPGKDPRYHRVVDGQVVLDVRLPSGTLTVKGEAGFHCVRGDSAAIPPGLGLAPDSTRWYIDLWVDDTIMSAGAVRVAPVRPANSQPTNSSSWGQLKAIYR